MSEALLFRTLLQSFAGQQLRGFLIESQWHVFEGDFYDPLRVSRQMRPKSLNIPSIFAALLVIAHWQFPA
jgi:hypothetical protein